MQPTQNRSSKNNPTARTNFYSSTPSSSDVINFQRKSFGNDAYTYANYQPNPVVQNNSPYYPQRYVQEGYGMPNYQSTGKQLGSSKLSNTNTNFTQINEKMQGFQSEMKQVIKKYNAILKIIEKHQQTINENRDAINAILKQKANEKKQNAFTQTQIQQLATKILQQDIFKTYTNKHNKQIYEHIFNTKQEIGILKEQLNEIKTIKIQRQQQKQHQRKQKQNQNIDIDWQYQISRIFDEKIKELSLLQMEQDAKRVEENQQQKKNPQSDGSKQQHKQQQEHKQIQMTSVLQDVEALIEKNKQQLSAYFADALNNLQGNLISKLIQTLNKPSLQELKEQLKPGPLRSLISPIIVTLREQFVVVNKNIKKEVKVEEEGSEQKSQDKSTEIEKVFPYKQNTYLVDKEGYLLDNQGKYLLTPQGRRVKLQPKHIQFLRKANAMG